MSPTPPAAADESPSLVIHLFGPLHVRVEGSPLLPVRSRKILWLLALLTLRQGRQVEREWLANTLWPDAEQDQAYANLRPALSQLRTALGSQAYRLQSPNRHTLLFDLTGAEVDVLTFDAYTGSNSPHPHEKERWEEAVALYRGPLLEGCNEDWAIPEREARAQRCLQTLQRLAEAAVKVGDFAQAVFSLRRAVGIDPLSDFAHQALMEALTQGGDRNAALDLYREFSERMHRELGAAPHEATTALYARLRKEARETKSHNAGAPAAPALPTLPVVTGRLPHPLTELVGREDERAEVATRLRRSRLVTLAGPGGIGKTRLAVAVASDVVRDHADGVWLVSLESLAPLADSAQVAAQIANVLEVREASGRPLLQSVTEHLRQKRLLLVLDNCEHVLEGSAQVAGHLLRECAGLRILATSREALAITGETAWTVPSLIVPVPEHLPQGNATLLRVMLGYEGIQLFVERAQAVQRDFALTSANARDVALLCARLEGIPFALELAAARTIVLTPGQILTQMDARPLDALSARGGDVVPRHRTLRATLTWSYDLLRPEAQSFLADLSVFRGGWTLEAAQAVCPNADAVEMLTVLQAASLIRSEMDKTSEDTCFSFQETVRQFAAEALDASGRVADVRQRHTLYYSSWLQEKNRQSNLDDKTVAHRVLIFRFIDREYANITAALSFALEAGEDERLVQMCRDLGMYWQRNGRISEGRRWMEAAARQITAKEAGLGPEERDSDARILQQESYLDTQAWLLREIGNREAAAGLYLRMYQAYRNTGNAVEGRTKVFNAGVTLLTTDIPRALTLLEENFPLEKEASPDGRGNPIILSQLAFATQLLGQRERSAAYLAETLSLCRGREESDPQGYARGMLFAGNAAIDTGDFLSAQERLAAADAAAIRMGDRQIRLSALCYLSILAARSGDPEQAETLLSEAFEVMGSDPPFVTTQMLTRQRADLLLAAGDLATSAALTQELLTYMRGNVRSFRLYVHDILLLLAEIALADGPDVRKGTHSARLLGAAEGMAVRLGLTNPVRSARERAARLRTALDSLLGTGRLTEELAAGALLDDEAAVEFALRGR